MATYDHTAVDDGQGNYAKFWVDEGDDLIDLVTDPDSDSVTRMTVGETIDLMAAAGEAVRAALENRE